jgi:hypothetical protein
MRRKERPLQDVLLDLVMKSAKKRPSFREIQRVLPEARKFGLALGTGAALTLRSLTVSRQQAEKISEMIHSEDEGLNSIQDVLEMQPVNALTLAHLVRLERESAAKLELKLRAIKGAEARHSEHRKNAEKMREIWAQGNFDTKDKCAEQECDALGMSFSSARKALRGAPDPPSCCK